MVTHVLRAELPIPDVLEKTHRDSLEYHLDQLKKAVREDERPRIVGAAKELVEATARIVLDARGDQPPSEDPYDAALNGAHSRLLNQRGDGVAVDTQVRNAGSSAKKLASQLGALRNTYGSGHGKATLPEIEDEVLETCVDGALLWTRWALRRLGPYIMGAVQPLIRDLHEEVWYSGDLASRLKAVDLPTLTEEDQRRVGVAVGQRASSNTFTVWKDGVDACIHSMDPTSWPPAYREGLAEGLFVNRDGEIQVSDTADSVDAAAQVLVPHADRAKVLADLKKKIQQARWSRYNRAEVDKVYRAMLARNHDFDNDRAAQRAWEGVIKHIKTLEA